MLKLSIKAMLFDYGGVIADEGFRDGLVAMAEEQGIPFETIREHAMSAVYDSGLVLGTGTTSDFWELMRERTGLDDDENTMSQRILDGFVLRPWMMDSVRKLHAQGYITGILSDQCEWLDQLNARDRFFDAFDYVFNSYHMGKGKRDPTLFDDIATKLSLAPGEILFIDDSISNIERARDAGWRVIHYTDRDSFLAEVDQLLL